jgi:hypothetical protein
LSFFIIDVHSFIEFAFDRVTLISQLDHIFDMLTWINSYLNFFFTFFILSILFIRNYCIFLFILFKLIKLIKFSESITRFSIIFYFLEMLVLPYFLEMLVANGIMRALSNICLSLQLLFYSRPLLTYELCWLWFS